VQNSQYTVNVCNKCSKWKIIFCHEEDENYLRDKPSDDIEDDVKN
jgi:hypothetical protein